MLPPGLLGPIDFPDDQFTALHLSSVVSVLQSGSTKQRELVSHLSVQIWFSDGQAGPVSLDTHLWLLLRYSDLAVSTGTSL